MLDQLEISATFTHAGSQHAQPEPIERIPLIMPRNGDRILFLHRDPIDTAVSGYHQAKKRIRNFEGSISEFIRHPHHGVDKIYKFNKMWLDALYDKPNAMTLRYEDLHEHAESALMTVAFFFNIRPSFSEISRVYEENRFDKMQTRELSGSIPARYREFLSPGDIEDIDSFKVRRGRVKGYLEELSEADLNWAKARLESLKCEV